LEPDELIGYANGMGFELIPLMPELAADSYKLNANWHKDPFDRMLIWQAIQNDVTLISKDANIIKYQSSGLKIIW
jgi:PIN domain nuclease of toxin-antitoxin system